MKYLIFNVHTIPCTETVNDVLSAVMGEVGFDSFVTTNTGIEAYIQEALFDEKTLKEALTDFPIEGVTIDYTMSEAEDRNWNEEWEKNFFQPIVIGDRCVIHSTFHKDVPQMEYDIVINPKMAFGTGHHETTGLIVGELLDADLEGKSVLDMGCGTSILAILARMRGASPVTAIDIDSWCVDNSIDNMVLNNFSDIDIEIGDAALLKKKGPFDVVIANINRNILLNDMQYYVVRMMPGAVLYMSGFYTEDIPMIRAEAERLGLTFVYHKEKNNWAAVKCIKSYKINHEARC